MYAKVFAQMFDGTLRTSSPWQALVTFQNLLILANSDGEVDMTLSAIQLRTGIPLEVLQLGIDCLQRPDPESRTATHEGRRLVPISSHRSWGWLIVNYRMYRQIEREEARREYHRDYKRQQRAAARAEIVAGQHLSTPVNNVNSVNTESTMSPIAEAEAEAEAEAKTKAGANALPPSGVQGGKTPEKSRSKAEKPDSGPALALIAAGVDRQVAVDWIAKRKAANPVTPTVVRQHIQAAAECGLTLQQAIEFAIAKNWIAFHADGWRENRPKQNVDSLADARQRKLRALRGDDQGVIDV